MHRAMATFRRRNKINGFRSLCRWLRARTLTLRSHQGQDARALFAALRAVALFYRPTFGDLFRSLRGPFRAIFPRDTRVRRRKERPHDRLQGSYPFADRTFFYHARSSLYHLLRPLYHLRLPIRRRYHDYHQDLRPNIHRRIRRHVITFVPSTNSGEGQRLYADHYRRVDVGTKRITNNSSSTSGSRRVPFFAIIRSDVRDQRRQDLRALPLRSNQRRTCKRARTMFVIRRLITRVTVTNDHDQEGSNGTPYESKRQRFLIIVRGTFDIRLYRSFLTRAHRITRHVDKICVHRHRKVTMRFIRDSDRLSRRLRTNYREAPHLPFGRQFRRAVSIIPRSATHLNRRIASSLILLGGLRVAVAIVPLTRLTRFHLRPVLFKRNLFRNTARRVIRFVGYRYLRLVPAGGPMAHITGQCARRPPGCRQYEERPATPR